MQAWEDAGAAMIGLGTIGLCEGAPCLRAGRHAGQGPSSASERARKGPKAERGQGNPTGCSGFGFRDASRRVGDNWQVPVTRLVERVWGGGL